METGSCGAGSLDAGSLKPEARLVVPRVRVAEAVLRRAGEAEAAAGAVFTFVSFLRNIDIEQLCLPIWIYSYFSQAAADT
jgi:hypothetical protein